MVREPEVDNNFDIGDCETMSQFSVVHTGFSSLLDHQSNGV